MTRDEKTGQYLRTDPVGRFHESYIPEPNTGCWLWAENVNRDGYGKFYDGTRTVLAHRYSFSLTHPQFDVTKCVLHTCDIPGCVNPDHLYLGTVLDNNNDKARRNRGIKSRRRLPIGVVPSNGRDNGRFAARAYCAGKAYYVGTFDSPEEAGSAAAAKRAQLWEGLSRDRL